MKSKDETKSSQETDFITNLPFKKVIAMMGAIWSGLAMLVVVVISWKGINKAGTLGDSFGVINSIFSTLAFGALWYSIHLQRKEFADTREEFVEQNENLEKQRFETSFFNMLESTNRIIDTRTGGRDVFRAIMSDYHRSLESITHNNDFEILSKAFLKRAEKDIYNMRQYFQSLYILIKIVDRYKNKVKEKKERLFYLSIVGASFSNRQKQFFKAFIAYSTDLSKDHVETFTELLSAVDGVGISNDDSEPTK